MRTIFERAAGHSRRDIDFFGTRLTLPPEARFASVASVQRYVDDVLALVHGGGPPDPSRCVPGVVRRRRTTNATGTERPSPSPMTGVEVLGRCANW
ncbi:Uncharacterised protein [Mycobacteroides abscessus]|nr:Uncharacterised protein [Mycobacteroides abscessus]